MHCSFVGHVNMNKENTQATRSERPSVRITRARAKTLGAPVGILPQLKPSFKQERKRVFQESSKRAVSDENNASACAPAGFQHKRRAVLKDVKNIRWEDSNAEDNNAPKIQHTKRGPAKKNAKVASNVQEEILSVQEDAKLKLAEELSRIRVDESEEFIMPAKFENKLKPECRQNGVADLMFPFHTSANSAGIQNAPKKEEDVVCEMQVASKGVNIVDIDSNLKDPQACSSYAPDIYSNIRITELGRRASTDYMEKLQQDITPSMRGILIDWLVEVSEEYKLVPDTLYLTVNLIDRFLSHNYIEKQRLQLLGVTCMLIASCVSKNIRLTTCGKALGAYSFFKKYEEICAPRVEEFCFITDNTYSIEEVLKMESRVLNFLHFQLSVPTTKTFLRRFIQAAQAFYEAPCVELEFLANYLAELTLVEYSFLKFLPSLIAASAVFLARWTLNQSDHPWNSTLEHYTSYKATELKTTVVALQDLQESINGCALSAIRDKYRLQKFKCVATLTSVQLVGSLF